MSKLEVDKVIPQSGTTLTIGDSGDTTNIVGTLQNNGSSLVGDISSVVAGTNLSGGGTSGDVTLNLADASTSAKGAASFSSDNFAASSGAITIKDLGIATAELQDNAVTTAKITDANVTTAKIADANVTTAKIADANVTTAKIADANITVAKMAANSVDSNQYVDGSIDTAHIANDQITNALMADNAIDTAQIAASAVETAKINDDAITLAKMAPGTDGNIISYDASGNPVAVATGSSGQVLTSAGAGAPPTFAAASGDVVLLHTTAAMSGSTVAVDNVFSATYKSYRVIVSNYYPAADTIPEFRFRNGGGGSNDSKYCYVHDRVERNSGGVDTATTATAWNNTLAAWHQSVDGGNGGYTANAIIDIFNPILTIPTWWTTASNGWDTSQAWVVNMTGGGIYNNSSAIDGIEFSTSSGNISGGVLKIYGFK